MRAPHPTTIAGSVALIVAGNLVIIAALAAQYFKPQPYGMFLTILFAGGVIAYSGFWGLNPKRTKDATQNLADVATKAGDVVVNVRTRGRRRTDPKVEVSTAPSAEPGGPSVTTVNVTSPIAGEQAPVVETTVAVPASSTPAPPTPASESTAPALPAVQPPAYPTELPGARVAGEGD